MFTLSAKFVQTPMKFRFWSVLALALPFCLALSFRLSAQSSPPRYFVVIGAFQVQGNAERLTALANKENLSAQYAINPAKGLFYVYVFESGESKKAFAEVIRIKAQTKYADAWVFKGHLGETVAATQPEPEPQPVVVPEEKKEEPVVVEEKKEEPVVEEPKPIVEEPDPIVEKADSTPPIVVEKPTPAGKPFLFRMISEATGNTVVGEVHVLESAKATQYQAFRSNELIYLEAPKNRNGTYQIVTLAPGYKEMKRVVNFNNPAASATETGPNQEFVISLPLVRVKMGDYIEFSNVRFFSNTAILQPEAQNELDGLVQLLKENEKYKIKIHGHVNGEGTRDIVSKGNSTEFFATSTDNLRESGSASRLSQLRADIVKEYLVAQGIDGKRITAKGEGGKQMIYPRNSTLAARNDRVEIEIKKGK